MNLKLDKFVILSPQTLKAFSETFKEKINVIIGEKDSGKSSLARSILYTLGCDVRNLDFISKLPENIYILHFSINKDSYILIRKKLKNGKGQNFFKIIKNNTEVRKFFKTGDFREYLNNIFNISMLVIDKNKQETKLYPNHIFLPFYIDQDFSWQNYLSDSFTGINFIKKYKKTILEYFTGVHSNKFYELKLKKDKLNNNHIKLEALLKSKELIFEENMKSIKIIENIDVDSFKKQYKYFLQLYENIIETEHTLKRDLNEKIYRKNTYVQMKNKLNSSIDNVIDSELNHACPNCNQKIENDMEENYKLYLTKQNLIKEREKISMYISDTEEEINQIMGDVVNIKDNSSSLKEKLDADSKKIQLIDRAKSYAFNVINENLTKEILKLKNEILNIDEELEAIEEELNKLNKNDVSKEYKTLMIQAFNELNIDFSFKNYYDSNLESVNISLSGASKVQAFLAQYLSIYEINSTIKDIINIPMFIDTFLKDDFNEDEIKRTATYIFNTLESKFQSFVFISDNRHTLDSIKNYNSYQLHLDGKNGLLNKDYNSIYTEYSSLLEI